MPQMTAEGLSRFFREGPVEPLRLTGIAENEDSRYLGAIGLHKLTPTFHSILGFNYSGQLNDAARFYSADSEPGVVAVFRQFESSKYQAFPEELIAGWVPHSERARLESWIDDMNQQVKALLDLKHRRHMAALDSVLVQFDDPASLSVLDESYDLTRLNELTTAERKTVNVRLAQLAQQEDERAIVSLGEFDTPESHHALGPLLARTDDVGRRARCAFARLDRGAMVADGLAADAANGNWPQRFAALHALAWVDSPVAVAELTRALSDANSELRQRALTSLLDNLGVGDCELRSAGGRLRTLLMNDDPETSEGAAKEIAAIARALEQGATLQELGLR
jgi:hypothetical protein